MDLAQAYFFLKSLKENIPNTHEVDQHWVEDYRRTLDSVEKATGADLTAFRVDQSELHNPVVAVQMGMRRGPGRVHYDSGIVVKRARLMLKLDAVLGYFQFKQGADQGEKQIGFKQ